MKILPWSHLPTPRDVERAGKILKTLRTKKGMTQRDVSELAGLTRRCVGLVERGCHRPSLNTLRKIAKSFRCKIEVLIGSDKDYKGKKKGPRRAPGCT